MDVPVLETKFSGVNALERASPPKEKGPTEVHNRKPTQFLISTKIPSVGFFFSPLLVCPRMCLPNFQLVISIERRVRLKFPAVNEGEFREALQSPHCPFTEYKTLFYSI